MSGAKLRIPNNLVAVIAVLVILVSVFSILEVFSKLSELGSHPVGKATQGRVDVCVDIPPVFPVIGNLTAIVGEEFDHYVIAYDNEEETVYFYDNTSLFNITETTGRILFMPNESDKGTHEILITVTDNVCEGVNVTQAFELSINASRLFINTIPNLTATEDILFYYDVNVTGGDEPYNFSSNETWFIINSTTGEIEFTPNNSDVGNHSVIVQVWDNQSRYDSQEVNFGVINTNDAPVLDMDEDNVRDLMPNQTMLENTRFYYDVNATDPDLDTPGSTEKLYFQDDTAIFVIDEDSGVILFTADEPYIGNNSVFISVSDGEVIDYQTVVFDIVWVNDMPTLTMSTVITHYVSDGNFSYDLLGDDEEDGGEDTGNLTFWSNWSELEVNSTTGVCFMEVNISEAGIVYNFNISLNDSLGGIVSKNLQITVVNINRPPTIDTYEPSNLNQTISETDGIQFNITASDLDGTTPVILWYLDETNQSESESNYSYTTNYNSAGEHNITVFASDGSEDTAVEWNVTVLDVTVPVTPSTPSVSAGGGGGGGGGGPRLCEPLWICKEWSDCERTNLTMVCVMDGIRAYECGMQTRECVDIRNCGLNKGMPEELRACIWKEEGPSCEDNIQNQRELGVDCGGPCEKACPSCYNGVQDEGEAGVDCGGPCTSCRGQYQVMEISGWVTTFGSAVLLVVLLLLARVAYFTVKKYALVYFKV